MVFQLLNGITKIKVSGSEARAYSKWADLYSRLHVMPNTFLTVSGAVSNLIVFGGTIVLYYCAYVNGLSASDYIGFNSAYSLFTSAVMAMAGVTAQISSLRPSIEMLRPIIEEAPETAGFKKRVEKLSGDIDVDRVRFRYNENMPYVLDDLELHIRAGEYIGIVGSSGCGKSTLFRVLLGFEQPQSGTVYYDSHDVEGLDLRSVRRRIGTVLQNGKLFSGDIYSNIVICAPWLTVDEAWEAAERSGFADDIRKMPMGMFTMISEGGGGLSGGQQQRLLIARALASDPDIVLFDEATSALDNITQAMVVNTLEEMNCTRIVIAHRLSTIRHCSRIIYLDKGKVVEEGTYDELMALGGKFAELASRQIA
jgi:ABC-type bacteriocin/lantibiotic exporter with double-glycine peptidase domain